MDLKLLSNLYNSGMSFTDLSKKFGIDRMTIYDRFKKYGIPTDPKRRKSREECNLWKGGRIKRHGYILVKVSQHPYANYGGYVREQRLVMEKYLGRHLYPGEIVHHINGVKDDNRLDNLRLFNNMSEHFSHHAKKARRDAKGKYKKGG